MTQEHTSRGDTSRSDSSREAIKAWLEGLEQRMQSCQAAAQKMEETLGSLPKLSLKEMREEIGTELEKKYISRVDLLHTLYEKSLKQAEQRIKRYLIIGCLTLPFLSLALIVALAHLMDTFS